jgi:hypothetical protein
MAENNSTRDESVGQLVACPFCGNEHPHGPHYDREYLYWSVSCGSCYAEGPQVEGGETDKASELAARDEWNVRAAETK